MTPGLSTFLTDDLGIHELIDQNKTEMVLLTNFAKISQNRPIFGTKLTRPPEIS